MRKLLLATMTWGALSAAASAPYPGPVTYTQPDGSTLEVTIKGNEHSHVYYNTSGQAMIADPSGMLQPVSQQQAQMALEAAITPMAAGEGLHTAYISTSGSPRVCVILVQFSDVQFTVSNPADYYNRWLNQEGFSDNGAYGSVRDYFISQSGGKFKPQFDVYGPVTLSSARKNYSTTGTNAYKMVHDGAGAIDSSVDFSIYDANNDGNVDNVYIIFAGQGANYGASNAPWAHNSECPTGLFSKKTVDGKTLYHYACVSEQGSSTTTPDGMGTFIHEFGHILGLPDAYKTDTYNDATPGFWTIMDYGNFLDNGWSPCNYSAYERHACGWLDYTTLSSAAKVNLRPMAEHNFATTIETGRSGDYYILENRPKTGWDRGLYGSGMLIWHIDASDLTALANNPNNDISHMRIDLIEADGTYNNEYYSLGSDVWPGTANKTSFTATSSPAMVRWNASTGSATTVVNKPVTNIAVDADGLVTFDFMGGSTTNVVDPAPVAKYTVAVEATPAAGGSVYIGYDANTKSTTVDDKTTITLHAVPTTNYKFDNWTLNGTQVSTQQDYQVTVTSATQGTYVAHFSENAQTVNDFTVSVQATPSFGGTVYIDQDENKKTVTVEKYFPVTIRAVPADGYILQKWTLNGEQVSTQKNYQFAVTEATRGTYTAHFVLANDPANYCYPEGNSTWTKSRRGVKTFTVSDDQGNSVTVDGPGDAYDHPLFVDRTEYSLVTNAGATLSFNGTATELGWMHSYLYIDFGNDGTFDVDWSSTKPHSDLIAHTGYSIDQNSGRTDTSDPTKKSDGSAVNHDNYFDGIPSYTLPVNMKPGIYRLRYKNDWNSTHPCGRSASTLKGYQKGNYMADNGGSMIDITLIVEESLAAIGDINADNNAFNPDAPYHIFNIQGQEISADINALQPGLYIIRQGNLVRKVIIR